MALQTQWPAAASSLLADIPQQELAYEKPGLGLLSVLTAVSVSVGKVCWEHFRNHETKVSSQAFKDTMSSTLFSELGT